MGTALAERESELRSVAATINYTRPIAERLHIDVRDFSRTNMQFEPHTMKICDARGLQERLSLDREGFVLASHKSAVAGSRDLELLGRDYHAEMVEPPQDNTLALCDGRSVPGAQTMEFDVTIGPEDVPGNTFVARVCRYNDAHRWYYFSNLTRDEVIVFKAFDSA